MPAGRREIPVGGNGPLQQFAIDLRALRKKAGLRNIDLSIGANLSESAVSKALSGNIKYRQPPTWDATVAIVRTCEGDVEEWRKKWEVAEEERLRYQRIDPRRSGNSLQDVPVSSTEIVAQELAGSTQGDTEPDGDSSSVDHISGFNTADALFVGPLEAPDRYALLGPGRSGGEGTVYPAQYRGNLSSPVRIAVKMFRRTWQHRDEALGSVDFFRDWFPVLNSLSAENSHLVRMYDAFTGAPPHVRGDLWSGNRGDASYVVMEWVEGPTLDEVVHGKRASLVELLTYVKDLAAACAALASVSHSAGNPLMHGDIKPSNCIITPSRGLVLIDFGAMQSLRDSARKRMYTLRFTDPEVIDGRPPSVSSEVYSIGLVLGFCVTGYVSNPTEGRSRVSRRSSEADATRKREIGVVGRIVSAGRRRPDNDLGDVIRARHPGCSRRIARKLVELTFSMTDPDPERRPDLDTVRYTLTELAGGRQRRWRSPLDAINGNLMSSSET
ncbi:Protein kinase domain-containing protein [Pseudonocardia oroxyli]|uniref:Protein kinase domain-containing protein n=1 Tax=Pseudonocardia oroxyli TaxID=366584 RepID=A0A1G7SW19_PSEOR|nr:Protein kinase domain-containing protein [Pseudonocardia oroxyli]